MKTDKQFLITNKMGFIYIVLLMFFSVSIKAQSNVNTTRKLNRYSEIKGDSIPMFTNLTRNKRKRDAEHSESNQSGDIIKEKKQPIKKEEYITTKP